MLTLSNNVDLSDARIAETSVVSAGHTTGDPTIPQHDDTFGRQQTVQAYADISLPRLLQLLFGLNGVTLALQSLSLMYIINTRAEIPLAYLPTYGALAFLPYSLKPIYAYLSTLGSQKWGILQRHFLFPCLLAANSNSIFALIMVQPGDIVGVFILAFLRGITDSWAELCLGLTLIDCARQNSQRQRYDVLASRFQSQAATARNVGSIIGSTVTCLLFIERQIQHPDDTQLSGPVADALLVATGSLQLTGAIFAYYHRDSFRVTVCTDSSPIPFQLVQQREEENDNELYSNEISISQFTATSGSSSDPKRDILLDEESALSDDDGSNPSYSSLEDDNDVGIYNFDAISSPISGRNNLYSRATNLVLVVFLQMAIILIAMKQPFQEWSASPVAWEVLVATLLVAILGLAFAIYRNQWWQKSHNVGLFLILRHAIPSASMLLYSFYYTLFQSSPLLLQSLSLMSQGATTLSSWTYGKLLSRFSSGKPFLALVAGTTTLGALASLSNLALVGKSPSANDQTMYLFWVAASIRLLTTFFGEWAFLPDVIVATTSLIPDPEEREDSVHPTVASTSSGLGAEDEGHTNSHVDGSRIAMAYGTMISCIDFGDQLGSMLAVPLVVLLGISRENGFLHLDRLIVICSLLTILSLPLLLLLRKK